MDAALKAFKL